MRSPVWRRSSIIAYIRTSSLEASRSARYSRGDKTRGGATSYLGWETEVAGLEVTAPSLTRYLKNDLTELSLREILLRVYFSSLSLFLNPSRDSEVIVCAV